MKVTGLVLSIGEASTQRAVNALQTQSSPCEEIRVIENVTPFHRAMNEGARQVETEFFLQCDADMVPDPDCIEVMLKHMTEKTGVAIAYLSDPLWGKIQAIKLFRTSCMKQIGFENHVSPDTHYIGKMTEQGFERIFVKRDHPRHGHDIDTLGVHDPEYTLLYTFQKFRLVGARMAKRGQFSEFSNYLDRFVSSSHPMANIAIIGISRGLFDEGRGDALEPYKADEDYKKLLTYVSES